MISARELAEIIGVNPRTLKKWRKSGRLEEPAYKRGNFHRWTEGQVRAHIEGKGAE
jgi:predicted site-specific integrase-resolvase